MPRSTSIVVVLLVLVVLMPMSASACTCFNPLPSFHAIDRTDEGPPALRSGTVRWTPDGASIVFAVSTVEAGAVYVFTSGGVPVAEHVMPIGGDSLRPWKKRQEMSISPDGSRLAFLRYEICATTRDVEKIYVMNTDGRRTRKVMDLRRSVEGMRAIYAGGLAWSLDGETLAVAVNLLGESTGPANIVRYRNEFVAVYTMQADGSDARMVAKAPGDYAGGLAWSPDGQLLTFMSAHPLDYGVDHTRHVTLHTLDVGVADPSQQSSHSRTAIGQLFEGIPIPLAWSPDGRELTFAASHGDAGVKLYTKPRDGPGLRVVADIGLSSEPTSIAWSPDGSQILFLQGTAVYLAEADGSKLRVVGRGSESAWAPDGSRIVTLIINTRDTARLISTAPDGSDLRALAQVVVVKREEEDYFLELANQGPQRSSADRGACSAGFVVADPLENPGLVQDCEALMELRDRLAPTGVLNWGPDTPIAKWEGVTIEGPTFEGESPDSTEALLRPRVKELSLSGYVLGGILPPDIARIAALEVLDLSVTRISGPIPPEIAGLTDLVTLDLDASGLFGGIPAELGKLENLTTLSLGGSLWPSNENLRGPIPPEIANLKNLKTLDLSGCLSGPIPPELGSLRALETLNLSSACSFRPMTIPPELGNLENLIVLSMRSVVDGPIPPELGDLESLEILDLSSNDLSGPIPPELGKLGTLRELDLSSNRLSGPIPQELAKLSALERLEIVNNNLTGCPPRELYAQGTLVQVNDIGCDPRRR